MNLPNKLTILRIGLTIFIIFLCLFPFYSVGFSFPKFNIGGLVIDSVYFVAGIVYIIAAFTDYLDGSIARRNNLVTDKGKLLDAIADKVLVNSVLNLSWRGGKCFKNGYIKTWICNGSH